MTGCGRSEMGDGASDFAPGGRRAGLCRASGEEIFEMGRGTAGCGPHRHFWTAARRLAWVQKEGPSSTFLIGVGRVVCARALTCGAGDDEGNANRRRTALADFGPARVSGKVGFTRGSAVANAKIGFALRGPRPPATGGPGVSFGEEPSPSYDARHDGLEGAGLSHAAAGPKAAPRFARDPARSAGWTGTFDPGRFWLLPSGATPGRPRWPPPTRWITPAGHSRRFFSGGFVPRACHYPRPGSSP